MEKSLIMQFSTSFEKFQDVDETRAMGLMRVCYTGENRNKTYISKEAIIDAIPSMFNKPIVCHYDLETDTIGGHDVVVATDKDGNMFFVNLTDGIGTIPESANYYFEEVTEDDGAVHEYFVIEAILWKRSPAYRKIARDGIEGQSMEILVKDGGNVNGIYHIDKFIFTAFCLLGEDVEPCFESASLQLFDLKSYREQFDALMSTMRAEFAKLESNLQAQQLVKGGEKLLVLNQEKQGILSQYNLELAQLIGDAEEKTAIAEYNKMSVAEFTALVEGVAKKFDGDPEPDPDPDPNEDEGGNDTPGDDTPGDDTPGDDTGDDTTDDDGNDDDGDDDDGNDDDGDDDDEEETPTDDGDEDDYITSRPSKKREKFSLTGQQMVEQIYVALEQLGTIENEWGSMPAYLYVDYSFDAAEVYCWDVAADWTLCGFAYSMNGDNVVIDVESKKRKKFSIVDFDEGEPATYSHAFKCIEKAFQAELKSLREFKLKAEKEERDAEVAEVFASFSDLDGIEAFDNLKVNYGTMTADEVKHECFAIRGEHGVVKFSATSAKRRIPIETPAPAKTDEPYNGFFNQFPPTI